MCWNKQRGRHQMIHWTCGRKNKYEKEEYCCVSVTTAVIWEEIKLSHSFHQAENGFSLTPIGDEMTSDTVNNGKYLSKVHLLKCYIIYLLYFSSEGNIGNFFTPPQSVLGKAIRLFTWIKVLTPHCKFSVTNKDHVFKLLKVWKSGKCTLSIQSNCSKTSSVV